MNKTMKRLSGLFRRVTTSGHYTPKIDGLRFVAVMPVVAFHLWGYWERIEQRPYPDPGPLDYVLTFLVSLGHYGAHLFFMISGIVLATPLSTHPPAGGHAVGYAHELAYGAGSPINNNTWSLEVEVQFYLLMPLVAAVLWLPPAVRRSLLVVAIAMLSTHAAWLSLTAPRTIIQYGQFFLSGVLPNTFWTTGWRDKARTTTGDWPQTAYRWLTGLRRPRMLQGAGE